MWSLTAGTGEQSTCLLVGVDKKINMVLVYNTEYIEEKFDLNWYN